MTFRPMPILTALSALSLVILLMLGTWQYQRYSEKMAAPVEEVIEEVAERLIVDINRDHPGNAQQVYGFADSEPIWRRYAPGTLSATGEAVLGMVEATGGAQPFRWLFRLCRKALRTRAFSRANRLAVARLAPMMRPKTTNGTRCRRSGSGVI